MSATCRSSPQVWSGGSRQRRSRQTRLSPLQPSEIQSNSNADCAGRETRGVKDTFSHTSSATAFRQTPAVKGLKRSNTNTHKGNTIQMRLWQCSGGRAKCGGGQYAARGPQLGYRCLRGSAKGAVMRTTLYGGRWHSG